MYSVLATLKLWKINPHTWLFAYLQACAENDHRLHLISVVFFPGLCTRPGMATMCAAQPAPAALTAFTLKHMMLGPY